MGTRCSRVGVAHRMMYLAISFLKHSLGRHIASLGLRHLDVECRIERPSGLYIIAKLIKACFAQLQLLDLTSADYPGTHNRDRLRLITFSFTGSSTQITH
jgi:hypothetical protein